MRGRDERWTTSRSDITTLTAIPISTFQMIVRKNVSDMSSRSIHARILCAAEVSAPFSFAARDSRWGHSPPIELGIARELREQREHDEADAVMAKRRWVR